jgi:hypothetical protein
MRHARRAHRPRRLYARLYEEWFGSGAVQALCSDGIVLGDGRCVRPALRAEAARPAVTVPG